MDNLDNIIIINNKKYIYDWAKNNIQIKSGIVYINDEVAIPITEE